MNIVAAAANAFTRSADAAAAVAGAASGAVINGIVGGIRGSAGGVRDGIRNGSQSAPAAALTFGLLGAVGLVEWPVLIGIGATALVLRQVRSPDPQPASDQVSPATSSGEASVSPITNAAPVKQTAAAKAAKPPARKTAARARRTPVKH